MTTKRWKHSNTTIYNLGYHLIWCPKYRKSVLVGDVEKRLKQLIDEIAKDIDVEVASLEVMPDHLHMFVKTNPTASPHWVVQQMKGRSSNILRKEFRHLRNIPTLWTRSYYCESVGHISEDTIRRYIEGQKGK
jgi:putative transposase